MNEVEQAWQEYREALEKCVTATKLAAFHTQEAADAVDVACQQSLLACFAAKEYIENVRNELRAMRN